MTYLDTHVVAWLYAGESAKLSSGAWIQINAEDDLRVSPMVELELEYMFEIRRATAPARTVLSKLDAQIGLQVCSLPFNHVIRVAVGEQWTRDPFDRIIVAHAKANRAGLVTSDERVRRNYDRAIW